MLARPRVLAVDDCPTNLTIVKEALEGKYELLTVADGRAALEVAPNFLPEIVLLDVMMPGMDGFEVCKRLKQDSALRHTRFIMVSAKEQLQDRIAGYEAGADDYLTKPFEELELLAKLSAATRQESLRQADVQDYKNLARVTGSTLELITRLRDAETGDHILRVRNYALFLATELGAMNSCGIDDDFLEDLYQASPLHDIGKIAIPEAILQKPGPLTKKEWREMQQHTLIGEEIINALAHSEGSSLYLRMAARIARSHHERIDGLGYPDGLRGDAIPLEARIVKVADVFDALLSSRVYKRKFTPEEAKQVFTSGRGIEFDAQVVDVMLEHFEEFSSLPRELASESENANSLLPLMAT